MMQLPNKWKDYTFGDIVKFSGGAQPPRNTFKFESQKGYIRLIQTRDYKSSKYITYIPEELARKKCEKDDIMIGRYGPPIFQILRGLEGAYNVALIKAVADEQQLNKEYLFYYISQYNVWAFVENLSQRSGGQTGVDLEKLREYPFPLPPLEEQRKIVQILKTVDDKIEVIKHQIIETQELKKGLMQLLLTKGIGHTEFKDSSLGMIPESWKVEKLGKVAKSFAGGTPKRGVNGYYGGSIPWIKSGEVNNNSIKGAEEHITELALKESSAKLIEANSILIAMYGATAGKIGMLKVSACSNQAVLAVSSKTSGIITNLFLYHYLKKSTVELLNLCQGSGQPNLSKGIVDNLQIPLPQIPEQQKISQILNSVDDKLEVLLEKKTYYQELKQGLMQQLLKGKIRVQV